MTTMKFTRHDLCGYGINPLWLFLLILGAILIAGCSTTPKVAPVKEVKIAVPVPCVPVQVAAPTRPQATTGMNILDLAKVALADRRILMGDAERLRAANKNPCPSTNGANQ